MDLLPALVVVLLNWQCRPLLSGPVAGASPPAETLEWRSHEQCPLHGETPPPTHYGTHPHPPQHQGVSTHKHAHIQHKIHTVTDTCISQCFIHPEPYRPVLLLLSIIL